jgi:hypothetical protein
MKHRAPADTDETETFTVVMANAFRVPFETWLQHEHLGMTPLTADGDPVVYIVGILPPGCSHR